MLGDSLYGPGWTGTPGIMTTAMGAVASPPPGDVAAVAGQPQPTGGAMTGCLLCQSPVLRQGVFIVGVIFLYVAWHSHLKSIME